MFCRTAVFVAIGLLAVAGCSRTVNTPTVLRQQTVEVSADAPFVDLDGQKIGLDGISPGETKTLRMTHVLNADGSVGVDVESALVESQ